MLDAVAEMVGVARDVGAPLHLSHLKALADETRVRIVAACRDGERCVCQLTALVSLAPSSETTRMPLSKE